jgi:hypothetical protein
MDRLEPVSSITVFLEMSGALRACWTLGDAIEAIITRDSYENPGGGC